MSKHGAGVGENTQLWQFWHLWHFWQFFVSLYTASILGASVKICLAFAVDQWQRCCRCCYSSEGGNALFVHFKRIPGVLNLAFDRRNAEKGPFGVACNGGASTPKQSPSTLSP